MAGDADGLGETRKRELVKSGLALGLRQEDDVFVVESTYVLPLLISFSNETTRTNDFAAISLTA